MSVGYQLGRSLADCSNLLIRLFLFLWLVVAFKEYTKAIDIWSVGCILAEMSEYIVLSDDDMAGV